MKLSIVSPIYRAKELVPILISRVTKSVEQITSDYEIILVDDACPENSWEVIEEIAKTNPKVVGIKLSRNFGQHHAITAGIEHTTGDWVVIMDCDLQDQPEEISKLLNKAKEGYDIVFAKRHNRKDGFLKKTYSKVFYRTLGYLTGTKQDETTANFGIYSKQVIQEIRKLQESIRNFPSMVKWVGFKSTSIEVEHAAREVGTSSYNFKRMINLALNVILAYSDKPIRLAIKLGFIISITSMIMSIVTLIRWFTGEVTVLGYSSLIISIWFLSGIILMTLGIIGLYVGKTFEGVKNRPLYIIEKKVN